MSSLFEINKISLKRIFSFHEKDVRASFRDTSSYTAADKIDTKVYFFFYTVEHDQDTSNNVHYGPFGG